MDNKKPKKVFELYLAGASVSFGISLIISLVIGILNLSYNIGVVIAPNLFGGFIGSYLISGKTPHKPIIEGALLGGSSSQVRF